MTPQQLQALETTLDRVPLAALQRAIRRRKIKQPPNARTTPADRDFFEHLLQSIATRENLEPEFIMGNSRYERVVRLRWEIYRRLENRGHNLQEIAELTGHDRTRVNHWIKKTRPMLKQLKTLATR